MERVIYVLTRLAEAVEERQPGGSGHLTVQEYCEYLLTWDSQDSAAHLRHHQLRRSEDVGRVVFALIEKGLISRQGPDSEADFAGLFVVD